MAAAILTPEKTQYRLPASDRRAILSKTDSRKRLKEIERQRRAFIQKFRNEFGQ